MASEALQGGCRLDGDGQVPGMGLCGPWSGQREVIHRAVNTDFLLSSC